MSVVPVQPQTCEAINPVSAGKSGFLDDGQFVVKSDFLTGSLSFNVKVPVELKNLCSV